MKTYNIKETAVRIRDLRISFGYTQETAAELLGVERSYISRIESGAKGCSVDLFIRLSELYHVPLDYLLCGRKEIHAETRNALDGIIRKLTDLRNQL